ncbi:MAG: hypothetical protein II567_13485 [Candidatus Riflebacteria bacterium]|nr:hypothetical protein [Candidatus Riflebacteria bacterium]
MKKYMPSLKALIPFGILCVLAGIFSFSANADSTITIPISVPKDYPDRKVTLSLRIPAQTEPLTRKEQLKPAVTSNRIIVWNSQPCPKLANDDEIHAIFARMDKKGWVKTLSNQSSVRMRPLEKYYAIQLLIHICNNVIEFGQSPNFNNSVKRVNLTSSDVEDLRRMLKRFEREIVLFCGNPQKMDKDLLIIQERLKKNNQGILRVIKVEGTEDGATVIHMTVD